jgi:hypothetical protein
MVKMIIMNDSNEERTMFSILSYFKAIIFYSQSIELCKNKEISAAIINGYYSIFHLAVSRIKLFEGYVFDLQIELCEPTKVDSSKLLKHKQVQKIISTIVTQKKISSSFLEALKKFEAMRVYVNYGPRLYKNKGYTFDSCSYPNLKSEFERELKILDKEFYNYVDSLKQIKHNPFHFTNYYKKFYFEEFEKLGYCSTKTLSQAKVLHDKYYTYFKKT